MDKTLPSIHLYSRINQVVIHLIPFRSRSRLIILLRPHTPPPGCTYPKQ